MTSLPLDDAKTYEMMARGDSVGVFQFESEGMQSALRQVKPTEFDDLVALVALYRPGAMDQIPTYARGKRNPDAVADPRRAPGADHRLDLRRDPVPGAGHADLQGAGRLLGRQGRRPAQGDRQEEPRRRWPRSSPSSVEGCRASAACPQTSSTGCGTTNEKSADYSFNKSHAACYALIAYRTAWLKANYPAEYMAALISSVMDTKDKVPFFAAQAEDMGIDILPPDVNLSDHEFVVVDGNIRFGLDAVKGVGFAAVEAIKAAREEGGRVRVDLGLLHPRRPARGQQARDRGAHQVRRLRLDRRHAQGHARRARAGAGAPGQQAQLDAQIGQGSIFDLRRRRRSAAAGGAPSPFWRPQHPPIPPEEFEQAELLAIEKEAIGLFISAHPLKEVREALRAAVDAPLAALPDRKDGDWVTAGGIITQAKKIRTKKGDPMMFATLDDLEGVDRGPHLRQGAGRVRGRARRRRGRARARARRPRRQGHLAHRPDRRAVPAERRGGRGGARGGRPRARRARRP